MAKTIKPEQLASAIAEEMRTHSKVTAEQVKKAIKQTGLEAETYIKGIGDYDDRRTKGYRSKFYLKETKDGYVLANKDAMLTQLLERGHATRNHQSRTRAFPHWEKTEEFVEKKIVEEIKKQIK